MFDYGKKLSSFSLPDEDEFIEVLIVPLHNLERQLKGKLLLGFGLFLTSRFRHLTGFSLLIKM